MKQYKEDILSLTGILVITFVSMFLFWNIALQGYSMPIQHKVNSSNKFTTTLGMVREIVIQYSKLDKPSEVEIAVYDSNKNVCWEKTYKNVWFKGENQTLQSFEKNAPLELPRGEYSVNILLNGEENNLNCRFIEYSGNYKNIYVSLCTLLLIGEIILYLLIRKNNIPIEKIYVGAVVLLGVILNFVMPPLGVADERTHFLEAYEISSKMMFQEGCDDKGHVMIRREDIDTIQYLYDMAGIVEWHDTFHVMSSEGGDEMVSSGYISSLSSRAPHAYLASAVGIAFARIIGVSGHILLLMGRLFSLICNVVVVAMAIRIIPYGKYFFVVLGMVPEVIYLFTSYSYDGLNIALCMLTMAYFLKLYNEKEVITIKELLIFCVILFLMVPIKLVYVFLGVLLFLLPIKKIKLNRKQMIGIGVATLSVVIVGCMICAPHILPKFDSYSFSNGDTTISFAFLMQEKKRSLMIFLNTIFGYTNLYMYNSMGEIIGNDRYSGFDTCTLPLWMVCAIIVLMIVGLEDTKKNNVTKWKRWSGIGLGFLMYLGVLASMLFSVTAVEANRVMGVQGRYLLPIYVLLPFIIKNNLYEIRCSKKKICFGGMGLMNLLFVFLIFWHYAKNYFV